MKDEAGQKTLEVSAPHVTPTQWRKLGFLVEKSRLPSEAYTIYRVSRKVDGVEIWVGKAYGRAELDKLLIEHLSSAALLPR
jgi:hypothetical protein